jgi:prepilin-type N-terminal cleavage/methylation domain-containing protein/prepilin-type processing-associated H-X9-DG protein
MSHVSRRGFTLIELIVVVLIIAVLAALVFPATRRVSTSAARMQCQNHLKQLMIGLHNYADTNGAFPPGCAGPDAAPETRLSWMVSLLPYVEQDALYRKFDLTKGIAASAEPARTPVKVFLCPAQQTAPGDAVSHYVALAGLGNDAPSRPADAPGNGFMGFHRATKPDGIKDGTSNTLVLIETRIGVGPWAAGGAVNVRGFNLEDAPHIGEDRPFGWHGESKGANAVMADGSVRFLSAKTDPAKLAAAITIAGNETITLD